MEEKGDFAGYSRLFVFVGVSQRLLIVDYVWF